MKFALLILLVLSTPCLAAQNFQTKIFFFEAATTYSAHYDFQYFDSTPRASLFGLAKIGIMGFGLKLYYEYAQSISGFPANSIAAGVRIPLFTPNAIHKFGLQFDELFYRNDPPTPPLETFSEKSTGLRYGLYLESKFHTRSSFYSIASFSFGRVSSNLFIFPSLGLGMLF